MLESKKIAIIKDCCVQTTNIRPLCYYKIDCNVYLEVSCAFSYYFSLVCSTLSYKCWLLLHFSAGTDEEKARLHITWFRLQKHRKKRNKKKPQKESFSSTIPHPILVVQTGKNRTFSLITGGSYTRNRRGKIFQKISIIFCLYVVFLALRTCAKLCEVYVSHVEGIKISAMWMKTFSCTRTIINFMYYKQQLKKKKGKCETHRT